MLMGAHWQLCSASILNQRCSAHTSLKVLSPTPRYSALSHCPKWGMGIQDVGLSCTQEGEDSGKAAKLWTASQPFTQVLGSVFHGVSNSGQCCMLPSRSTTDHVILYYITLSDYILLQFLISLASVSSVYLILVKTVPHRCTEFLNFVSFLFVRKCVGKTQPHGHKCLTGSLLQILVVRKSLLTFSWIWGGKSFTEMCELGHLITVTTYCHYFIK